MAKVSGLVLGQTRTGQKEQQGNKNTLCLTA
jgi:hypothetical protein